MCAAKVERPIVLAPLFGLPDFIQMRLGKGLIGIDSLLDDGQRENERSSDADDWIERRQLPRRTG